MSATTEIRNALIERLGQIIEGEYIPPTGLCGAIDDIFDPYFGDYPDLINELDEELQNELINFAYLANKKSQYFVYCSYPGVHSGPCSGYPLNANSQEYWEAQAHNSLYTTRPANPFYEQAERRRACAIHLVNYIGRNW